MISIADGRIPAATIRETASPASSIERKPASCVTTDLGPPDDPERHLDRDPERPLRADHDAEQVGPVVAVDRLAAECEQLAVGQDDLRAGDVVDREAVLEAVRAAGVLRDVAADGADLLARRVGGVEVALGGDGAGHVEVRDARLDDHALALEVDLEDPAHPRDGDDDPVRDGKRAAGEARPGAARDEGDAVARAQPKHRLHLLGRARKHDARGLRAPAREPVAVVGREVLGGREHVRLADRRGELVDESGRKRHRRDPTDASFAKHRSSMICMG